MNYVSHNWPFESENEAVETVYVWVRQVLRTETDISILCQIERPAKATVATASGNEFKYHVFLLYIHED